MQPSEAFSALVEKDIKQKDGVGQDDLAILESDVASWINVLKDLKLETELHFIHLKLQQATQAASLSAGEITQAEYDEWLVGLYKNRLNSARFLKTIETRLIQVRNTYGRQRSVHQGQASPHIRIGTEPATSASQADDITVLTR